MMKDRILTEPQQRYLNIIRSNPGIALSGRAGKSIGVLKQLGLITYKFNLVSHAGSNSTSEYTCYPTPHPDNWPGEMVDTLEDLGHKRRKAL